MLNLPIHDETGAATGRTYSLDPTELVQDVHSRDDINRQLLHDAVVMYEANRRQGTFKSKGRGEVAGSKKKLYKQKGTGRARAGAKRTCVRRGGGHAFAKRPRDFYYRLPRKALRKAMRLALLSKFFDGEAVVVEKLSLNQPKTRVVAALLNKLGLAGQTCLVAIDQYDPVVWKSARNIPGVGVSPATDLNAYELLRHKRLLVTTGALDRLRQAVASERAPAAAAAAS
ncbi:MAG: 50S ribosomal protein L4 [Planctomycetaceae bacterium]|nr:MAG: 50S ribosomal protein L4 [Planctomycetaceae bacterium]